MEQKKVVEFQQSGKPFKQEFAELVLSCVNKIDSNKSLKDEKMLILATGAAITYAKYDIAIASLMELIDLKQNIFWYINPISDLTQREMLIRDGRKATSPHKGPEAYIIIGLNYIRATKALLGQNYDKVRGYLNFLASNYYIKMMQLQNEAEIDKTFRHFNSAVVHTIAYQLDISFDDAAEYLSIAKDFANFEDPTRDIVTLTTLSDHEGKETVFFQGDSPLTKLTDNLKNEYNDCAKKAWFMILKPVIQDLIKFYIPTILTETKVFPTQPRKYLPGMRNCYHAVYGSIAEGEVKITTSAFHSGTLVSFCKEASGATRLNLLHGEQLKAFTKAEKILVLTLNTLPKDWSIVNGSSEIALYYKFFHANLPLNMVRAVAVNNYDGINTLLNFVIKDIADKLAEKIPKNDDKLISEIKKYLSQTFFFSNDTLALLIGTINDLMKNNAENSKIIYLCEIISVAIDIRTLTLNNKNPIDPDNKNLFISALTNILVNLLQDYISIAINSSCESGKDRNGLLMFLTALLSFIREIYGTYSLQSNDYKIQTGIKNIIIMLCKTRHQNFLAGCQGGGIGNFGIKNASSKAIPQKLFPQEAANLLIEKTASYNKEIPLPSTKQIYFPTINTHPDIQRHLITHVLQIQNKIKPNPLLLSTIEDLKKLKLLEEIVSRLRKLETELKSTITLFDDTPKLIQTIISNLNSIVESISLQNIDDNKNWVQL